MTTTPKFGQKTKNTIHNCYDFDKISNVGPLDACKFIIYCARGFDIRTVVRLVERCLKPIIKLTLKRKACAPNKFILKILPTEHPVKRVRGNLINSFVIFIVLNSMIFSHDILHSSPIV
uniref:Uncharacterized protein n=1 Tax=Glossina austeni TaxID=7395 RepID=A0A1A9V439_GLOAU